MSDTLLAIIVVVLAALGFGGRQYIKGRSDMRTKQQERDRERANDIRDRFERDLPDRVREYEGRGYRD